MDAILTAFESVLPLFLVIFTGMLFSKRGIATVQWVDVLNKYALLIGFPALVIVSLLQLDTELKHYVPLILINSAHIVVSMFLVYPVAWIFKLSKKMKQALLLIFPFGNIAYLGIPVLENAYGSEILPVAAILSSVYVFWMLTLALTLIELDEDNGVHPGSLIMSLLKNPLLISVFIGIIIVSFKISVPTILDTTLQFFSQSVTAIVLFSLGIFLGMQRVGDINEWKKVALCSTTTMVILPGLFYIFLQYTGLPLEEMKASVVDAAMPLGLTPYALAVQYNLKSGFFARSVVFSTLISIVILPVWLYFLG